MKKYQFCWRHVRYLKSDFQFTAVHARRANTQKLMERDSWCRNNPVANRRCKEDLGLIARRSTSLSASADLLAVEWSLIIGHRCAATMWRTDDFTLAMIQETPEIQSVDLRVAESGETFLFMQSRSPARLAWVHKLSISAWISDRHYARARARTRALARARNACVNSAACTSARAPGAFIPGDGPRIIRDLSRFLAAERPAN